MSREKLTVPAGQSVTAVANQGLIPVPFGDHRGHTPGGHGVARRERKASRSKASLDLVGSGVGIRARALSGELQDVDENACIDKRLQGQSACVFSIGSIRNFPAQVEGPRCPDNSHVRRRRIEDPVKPIEPVGLSEGFGTVRIRGYQSRRDADQPQNRQQVLPLGHANRGKKDGFLVSPDVAEEISFQNPPRLDGLRKRRRIFRLCP